MSQLNRYMLTWLALIVSIPFLFSTFIGSFVGIGGVVIFSGIFGWYSWEIASWFSGIKIEDIK